MSSLTSRRRGTRVVAGLLALGLVGGLALQACGSDSSSSSTDTTTADGSTTTTVVNTTSLDEVKVEGDFGSKPTVTFDPSYVGTEDSFKVVSEGDGPVITADQRVTVNYLGVAGADGTELGGTYGATPEKFFMADTSLRPVITESMIGQKVGSRVMIAVDATAEQRRVEHRRVRPRVGRDHPAERRGRGRHPGRRPARRSPSRTACPPSPRPTGDAADHARRAAAHQGLRPGGHRRPDPHRAVRRHDLGAAARCSTARGSAARRPTSSSAPASSSPASTRASSARPSAPGCCS